MLVVPGTQLNSWQHATSENPQGGIQANVNGQFFTANGFLLDGYPRTVPQAVYLSRLLRERGLPEPTVIHLDVPDEALVTRHPFPGPGLAVRLLGEVTEERLAILRQADDLFIRELKDTPGASGGSLYDETAQAFAVLLPVKTVGVMGDGRTYENVLALRAVTTDDFMTADWARLPHDFLARVSARIVNTVRGVNRVVYDVSSKPPSTIEWE